jgi:hypothetical protein
MYVLTSGFGDWRCVELLGQVRTKAIPKAQRRRDWLRPLWLLGMVLYMCAVNRRPAPLPDFTMHRLSQLIGSTLALEYMRAGLFLVILRTSQLLTCDQQNMSHRWDLALSYLTFYLLDS